MLFENAVVDIISDVSSFGSSEKQGLSDRHGEVVDFATTPTVDFLAFNSSLPPYDDVNFRRALVSASHLDALMGENGFSMGGTDSAIAYSLLPPNFLGHIPEDFGANFDPDQAANLLAESRFDPSRKLTFRTYVGGYAIEEFHSIASGWNELLGIEYDVNEVWLDEFDNWLRAGEVEIMRVSVTPLYADPSAILGIMEGLFGDRSNSPETDEINKMLDAATGEPDAATRLGLYHELEHYLIDNALVLPIFWTSDRRWVRVQPWIVEYAPPKY